MNGKKDEKRVEKILKNAGISGEDELVDDPNDESEETKIEVKELEKLIEDKHSNFGKISRHFKLFDYVSKADPDQVLRYIKNRHPSIEPLWMSDKN